MGRDRSGVAGGFAAYPGIIAMATGSANAEFLLDRDPPWRSTKAQREEPPAAAPGTSGAKPTRVGV
jgi:hypothetical protein